MYAAFVNQLRTTLLCLNHSAVLIVSPIWAGSFRTQGQGNLHCTIISEIYTNCSDFQLANKLKFGDDPRLFHDADGSSKGVVTTANIAKY